MAPQAVAARAVALVELVLQIMQALVVVEHHMFAAWVVPGAARVVPLVVILILILVFIHILHNQVAEAEVHGDLLIAETEALVVAEERLVAVAEAGVL